MFVGEMGCWLVVGLAKLVSKANKARKMRQEDGYRVVNTEEEEEEGAEERAEGDDNPVAKILNTNEQDDRLPLEGFLTFLLAIPALCE